MTTRPGLAMMKLADVVPKKNFPIKVPWLFHTYVQSTQHWTGTQMQRCTPVRRLHILNIRFHWDQPGHRQRGLHRYMQKLGGSWTHMNENQHRKRSWKSSCMRKDLSKLEKTYIVAGCVWSFPKLHNPAPVSALPKYTSTGVNSQLKVTHTYI